MIRVVQDMNERTWTIDDYLEKLYPRCNEKLSDQFTESSHQMIQDKDITDELLKESYIFMAHIVKTYGEQFLPIFERLHSEIESRKEKQSMLDTAMELSNSAASYNPD